MFLISKKTAPYRRARKRVYSGVVYAYMHAGMRYTDSSMLHGRTDIL